MSEKEGYYMAKKKKKTHSIKSQNLKNLKRKHHHSNNSYLINTSKQGNTKPSNTKNYYQKKIEQQKKNLLPNSIKHKQKNVAVKESSVTVSNITISKKKKIQRKNIITYCMLSFLFLVFLTIFTVSIKDIMTWKKDNAETKEQIKEQVNETKVSETVDTEKTEVIQPKEEIPKENPYWDYIKMKLIHVDFSDLKSKNKETVGWIQVNGTNINYPFVQSTDNSFYLNHSFNKSYNEAGWVFMDYRNNPTDFDQNTILYAHGRIDNTMFGSLRKILQSKWLDNSNNYIIKLSTETENTLWQVFSVYKIPTTTDYLTIHFSNQSSFLNFASLLLKRSQFDFNTAINENDKILTLSTCYDDHEKVVLHAKLIKKEKRNI